MFSQLVAQVFIATGLSSGVGKELSQVLYAHDANVYVAARSKERAGQVVGEIRASFPASKGELVYLHLDLEDLSAIKASAEEFLDKEDRLDVLWSNAAVMNTPAGSKTKQGYNCSLGLVILCRSCSRSCLRLSWSRRLRLHREGA